MKHIDINVAPGPIDPVVTIGYLTEWADRPGTFDGWLEHPDLPADKLVINGASEAWARYRVLRAYLDARFKEIDKTDGSLSDDHRYTVLDNMGLLAAVGEEMEMALLHHTQQD